MTSSKRLIEVAFPLKQTSLDSVHEKNVRHGHISTLHIWPARRPLAASRAALIATLLPDPQNDAERKELLERLAGRVVERPKKKKQADGRMVEEMAEETEGGILHWGRESGPDLDFFRQKIRQAYGGRAPRVLDPFSGGGAIPLEAMRLGCEATAVDINPVAWFILKCTLEYPQKLAGQTRPLPDFALRDREFMESFLKSKGFKGPSLKAQLANLGLEASNAPELPGFTAHSSPITDNWPADLAWHVRAWGRWVLAQARRDLARFYPTYADFEPLVEVAHAVERRPLTLVPLKQDGAPDLEALNAEFGEAYLANKSNPRWVAKPTVAYLWARTVSCKNCGTLIPLLKTRWLCKKDKKRVLLTLDSKASRLSTLQSQAPFGDDKTLQSGELGVTFAIQTNVPVEGRTSAERIAHDKQIGGGTMSRSGAHCPVCNQITMTSEDIRLEGRAGRLGAVMTAVVVDGQNGKEYRLPAEQEFAVAAAAELELDSVYANIPYGLPNEAVPEGGSREGGGSPFTVHIYGMTQWKDLFTYRQLLGLGTFVNFSRTVYQQASSMSYPEYWAEAIVAFLALALDRLADRSSCQCHWDLSRDTVASTFVRFALPINWDYCETNVIGLTAGSYDNQLDWIALVIEHVISAVTKSTPTPNCIRSSALDERNDKFDLVLTDPPYYDAIPYSDLMDFYYIWLRRTLSGISPSIDLAFQEKLSPKWNHQTQNGELIDDASRFDGDKGKSKSNYENGMARVFEKCHQTLVPEGRLVIVFAHKHPNAWETLVSAIIRAGFVVDGSWPIQTEMSNRSRAHGSAALASSVWLVCRKRPESARPGWDNRVQDEMRLNISERLRQFWDAGIRGPDFVWAATGPALEAYSQYPIVKKANQPGEILSVGEFLTHVRRMVVDFVVGRVLTTLSPTPNPSAKGVRSASPNPADLERGAAESVDVSSLDAQTTYYLLHRNDFGLNDAPAGPCILYAVSCGLSDGDLADRFDLLARRGGKASDEEEPEEGESASEGTGSVFRLKAWNLRKRPGMGFEAGEDQSLERLPLFPDLPVASETRAVSGVPLIDQVHRLMHLWRAGDVVRVDDYLERRALKRNQLFHQLLQALIELSTGEERSLLESISNHVGAGGKQTARLM